MTQADFYTLSDNSPQACLYFACRLTEKAWSQGLKVYLQVNDRQVAEELDNLLWSFRPDSFIPHATTDTLSELDDEEVAVIIGYSDNCDFQQGLLVNLTGSIPDFFKGFERVAEIVADDEQAKQVSREHWKHYKAAGLEPKLHKL